MCLRRSDLWLGFFLVRINWVVDDDFGILSVQFRQTEM